MLDNNEYVKAYEKGRKDGEKAVLRMVEMIRNSSAEYFDTASYYKGSLDLLLEVFNYGKE